MEVLLNMHKQSSNQNEFIIEVLKATEELMSRPMKKKKNLKKTCTKWLVSITF